eukprot:196289-Prorocentrum_minimum.AAC.1
MSLSRLAGFKCVPVVIQVLGCLAEYRPLAAVDAEAAPPLVLDCMRAHPAHAAAQRAGCRALAAVLARRPPAPHPGGRHPPRHFPQAPVITGVPGDILEAVLSALRNHLQSARVQEYGALALCRLA